MTDDDLATLIEQRCSTRDEEANGCHLDRIIVAFLRDQGFTKSADRFENVECWR